MCQQIPLKSMKSRHNSLLRQNSVKFCINFTRVRKHFTRTLFARSYFFASLLYMYSTRQYSTRQYSTRHYSTRQYSTRQYSTRQYSTKSYGTVKLYRGQNPFYILPRSKILILLRTVWEETRGAQRPETPPKQSLVN